MTNKRTWVVSADVASVRSALIQVYTPLNPATKSNYMQSSGMIFTKICHQSSSSVSWQDLNLGSVPVHNHAQFSNVCVVTLEICDDCDHGWSNLDHPVTKNKINYAQHKWVHNVSAETQQNFHMVKQSEILTLNVAFQSLEFQTHTAHTQPLVSAQGLL